MAELHDALVQRAVRWLRNTKHCPIALAECGAGTSDEIPDAIGWCSRGYSTVVECKTSLSDFYADRSKPSRRREQQDGRGQVGHFRYYFAPAGILRLELIPEPWGFLELVGDRVMVRRGAARVASVEQFRDVAILVAELRRVTEGWRKPNCARGVAADAACERDFPAQAGGR